MTEAKINVKYIVYLDEKNADAVLNNTLEHKEAVDFLNETQNAKAKTNL